MTPAPEAATTAAAAATPAAPSVATAAAPRALSPGATLALACCLFVLSGACGLAYEVVWGRFLGLFLGSTVLQHTLVLGTFMGGLALGSLLIGRRVARVANPLRAYGFLEVAVAAYAGLFPVLADAARDALFGALRASGGAMPGLLGVKALLAVLLIGPPTLLMGATLPLLTAHVERALAAHRRGDGANWLYFANCAGAVLGTLITGFVLIPSLGMAATTAGVAIVNAGVGVLAILAGMRFGAPAGPAPVRPAKTTAAAAAAAPPATAAGRVVLVAICLSGATAFFYELVWTRLFAVALGSSTYSFTLMLAAFITGLCLGSVAANVLPVRRAPLLWFAGAEIAIGIAIALSLSLYPRIPYWSWHLRWLFRPVVESLPFYRLGQYGMIFAVMAVPTFLFGLTFPAAIRAAAAARRGSAAATEDAGADVAVEAARVYGWNTLGTLAGVALAGFVLIPTVGLQRTLQAGAALNLLIGVGLLLSSRRRGAAPVAAYAAAGAGLLAVLLSPRWLPNTLTFTSVQSTGRPPATFREHTEALAREQAIRFYREDSGTTVAVVAPRLPGGAGRPGAEHLSLIVDGKADASSTMDMPTQKLLGHLPLFLKPDAKSVFVLGLGSGATAGAVLTHPGVERVDCVEISPAVAEASRLFDPFTGGPSRDPRFRLHLDDGRTFVAGAPDKKYDLVLSEPTNPWIAGVGNLFSEESFRAASQVLKDDGLVAQWFHVYSLDDRLAATIIRTCRRVFPHAVVFQGGSGDYILVAGKRPLSVHFPRMEQEFAHPSVRSDLAGLSITSVAALLAQHTHTRQATEALEQGGGINTDDLPILEYDAPVTLYTESVASRLPRTDLRPQSAEGRGLLLDGYFAYRSPTAETLRSLLVLHRDGRYGQPALHRNALQALAERFPDSPEARGGGGVRAPAAATATPPPTASR